MENIHKNNWFTLIKQRIKLYKHLNRIRKSIWQNSTFIYNKNSQWTGYKGNIFNIIKAIYEKPTVNNRPKMKTLMLSSTFSNWDLELSPVLPEIES